MAYDEDLAARVRALVVNEPGVVEKKMFGGIAFLIGGNMAVSASGQGGLLLRVDPDQTDALAKQPHAEPFAMRGSAMRGWLRVAEDGVRTRRDLAAWVARGVGYARTLAPKGSAPVAAPASKAAKRPPGPVLAHAQEGGRAKRPARVAATDAAANITRRLEALADWRGETLSRVRTLVHEADPQVEEEWKWAKASSPGTPVWSHDGILCTGESYKQVVKLTFARGASLPDPKRLFNASLDGGTRRAIDLREGDALDAAAFKQLIRAAVAANTAARAGTKK